ncbi:MAG: LysE family transporter [Acidihalobacter sp.]
MAIARANARDGAAPRRSLPRTFLHANPTTVLNPKSILFFVVFVPQFMDTHAPLAPQLAMMPTSILLYRVLIDGNYALFASRLRPFIRTSRMQRAVYRTSGERLVAEGILAAIWRALWRRPRLQPMIACTTACSVEAWRRSRSL